MQLSEINSLDLLEKEAIKCTACILGSKCQNVVFGEGNPNAKIVFCGEAPGGDEDRLGRPFVGKAGQLLDKMLAACGFERFEQIYILNVVKCRPSGNRIPTEEERKACRPILDAQLRLINPVIMVLLGACALQEIVNPNGRITKDRGKWVNKNGIFIMPTYHPAALLRNPNLKRDAWTDLKQVVFEYRRLVDPNHYSAHC